LVYTTAPKKATGLDGFSYFVKGPDLNIVAAEAVAHQLAEGLGLRIPKFGIAVPYGANNAYFASREVVRCQRQIDTWLTRRRITNRELLSMVTAFDIWVMNKDRNIGNLVGEEQLAPSAGMISIVAIDFEKSMALRGPYPLTATPQISPRSLWPSGTLGQLIRGFPIPNIFCGAIEAMTRDNILDAFGRVEACINAEIPWKENSAQLLATRAGRIRPLVAEVWQ
jgi:hypothetical protein